MKCNNCNSSLVYYRIKTNELVCRTCGNIEKLKPNNSEENLEEKKIEENNNADSE